MRIDSSSLEIALDLDFLLFATVIEKMKTTKYFDYTRKRSDRERIKDDWIEFVINNTAKTEVQSDGRKLLK